ncbi:hypothetical protein [Ruminococcus sp.]|uniref:hypothetical protein n=1 Tax=Ruminococcus sp. TaxID=41978 RepID=UPI0025CBE2BB|nr:hypothetical protein [Ruminococcus sp.]
MLLTAVCFVGVVFSVLSAVIWFRKKNIIEGVVMGVVMWFFAHIFASMGLFVIDKYTIYRAGCGALAISAVVMLLVLFLRRSKPFRWRHIFKNDFSLKDMLIPIIVCILSVPFVSQKNEYFGMGQDQGVYQTQAILFMNGDTKRQKDISEYHDLDTDEEREQFENAVMNDLSGYDVPDEDYPDTVYDRNVSPVSGIIHGIPTYSALLAMWGTIFGMSSMQGFETLLFICLIFIVYFICRNLKLKPVASACACAAAAFAPVIIWAAKASLTEMLLTLIPVTFLYFMTDDDDPKHKWLSVIPIAVFGCYHVSIYTMLPMFVLIYGGMYVFTRDRQYAVLMPVTILGYLASYFMMRQIQPFYTMNNYSPVFVGGIGVNNINVIVSALSAGAAVAVLLFIFIVKKRTKEDFSSIKFTRDAALSKGFILLLRLMVILPTAYIIARAFMKYSSWKEANHLALWGFAGNAGLVLMPLGMIFAVIYAKYFAERQSRLVLFIMFFYCILVYSSFLRYDIQYFYYYSRYLTPFIPVAVIFSVAALDRAGGKVLVPATALGLMYLARFDGYLMLNKDDTRMEWSIIEDIADFVDKDDCVVISPTYASRLWLPVKSMTGAAVVPENRDDAEQIDRLAARYGRVIVITELSLDNEDYSSVYSNKLHHIEDDGINTGRLVPLSRSFWVTEEDIRIYSYDKYRFMYTAAGDYTKMSGVSQLESYFCWTDSEKAQIECGLYPGDYDITMEFGCGLPLDKMGTDRVEVTLLMNGEKIGTEAITPENNGQPLHFEVDSEQIEDGENILEIQSPLWSASVSNPVDDRQLGIAIQSVRFSLAT